MKTFQRPWSATVDPTVTVYVWRQASRRFMSTAAGNVVCDECGSQSSKIEFVWDHCSDGDFLVCPCGQQFYTWNED